MNYENIKRYEGSLNYGKELMSENPFGSFLYDKGQDIVRWACQRIIELGKVELSYPAIGSMDEKMEAQALEVNLEN